MLTIVAAKKGQPRELHANLEWALREFHVARKLSGRNLTE